MKKPRKPFKKVIIKSRKITEPTVIPESVEIKPCVPAYAGGLEPQITAKASRVMLSGVMRSRRWFV